MEAPGQGGLNLVLSRHLNFSLIQPRVHLIDLYANCDGYGHVWAPYRVALVKLP